MVMSVLMLAAVAGAACEQDAVAAAPRSHEVLLENERLRVLRVVIAPGETEPVHAHCWPSVMYFEQPQPITYVAYKMTPEGPVEVQRVDAPALAAHSAVEGDPEGLHAIRNRGTLPFMAVRVEFKTPGHAAKD